MYRMRPRLCHTRGPDSPLERPGVSKSPLEGGVGGCFLEGGRGVFFPVRPLSAWERRGVIFRRQQLIFRRRNLIEIVQNLLLRQIRTTLFEQRFAVTLTTNGKIRSNPLLGESVLNLSNGGRGG